jgi:5-methylcytosine-specific restriction endonuclease McrA
MDNISQKTCTVCLITKPATYEFFYKQREKVGSRCKECCSAIAKKWRFDNKERHATNNKKWATQNKKRRSEYKKQYNKKNAKHNADINKIWRKNNSEKLKENLKLFHQNNPNYRRLDREINFEYYKNYYEKWRSENKEKVNKYSRKRRALKSATLSESYSAQLILEIYGYNCYICFCPIDVNVDRKIGKNKSWQFALHLDHVIPLSKGGTDLIENIRPTHAVCNLKKGSKTPKDFDTVVSETQPNPPNERKYHVSLG